MINVDKMLLENIRRVYVKSKIRGEEHLDDVFKETFFDNLCSDEYVDSKIETDVRETVDGERETLDALLFRVDNEHKSSRINWEQFVTNFTKRGKIRQGEEIIFGPPLKSREEAMAET